MQVNPNTSGIADPDRLDFSTNDDDYPAVTTPMPFRQRLLIGVVLGTGLAIWSAGLVWLGMQIAG